MCRFLSAIVLQSGEVFCAPESTDSHEDLIEAKGLSDNGCGVFVRVEFVPVGGKYGEPGAYKLYVDQPDTPDWWTTEVAARSSETLRQRIVRMIITEDRQILLGGAWILSGDPKIRRCVRATIEHAGSATIERAESATIEHAGSATIRHAGSATIRYAESATIRYAGSATIRHAGSATIRHAESATIRHAESATIRY